MNKYKLAPGDIIKIGRISLRIRDIHFSQDSSKYNNKKEIFTNVENADFNLKDLNTLRTEANINNNNSSRNYISKQLNYFSHLKSKKKIKYVEYVTWRKMIQKIIHYYNLVYVQAL